MMNRIDLHARYAAAALQAILTTYRYQPAQWSGDIKNMHFCAAKEAHDIANAMTANWADVPMPAPAEIEAPTNEMHRIALEKTRWLSDRNKLGDSLYIANQMAYAIYDYTKGDVK